MPSPLLLGRILSIRTCARKLTPLSHGSKTQRLSNSNFSQHSRRHHPTKGTRNITYLVGATTLIAAPFVVSSIDDRKPTTSSRTLQEGYNDSEETLEKKLLKISKKEEEAEQARRIHAISHGQEKYLIIRAFEELYAKIDYWVIEPIATGLRFIHLATIFLPVIMTVPVIWVGRRVNSKDGERTGTLWWYSFLVKSMERAGATFIKLGQWAATRTDIFPAQLCKRMSNLHSNVAAHSLSKTKAIVEDAFDGRPFGSIFSEFDETPLGIGAIAQVYRAKVNKELLPSSIKSTSSSSSSAMSVATLKSKVDALVKSSPPDIPSSWVAIKVLHPNVHKTVNRDIRIMYFFASAIDRIPTLEWLSLPGEVEKFGEMMRLQLDLRIEANNLVAFRGNFGDRSAVTFPIPYVEYTTRRVLIEEFAHGIPLRAFLEAGGGAYQHEMADMGLDAFLHMLLIDNFTHADLHPGNIMVRFYRPVQLPTFSQFHLPFFTPGSVITPEKVNDAEEIQEITEEALSRLRPHLHDPDRWVAELNKLDDEGYRPQLIFIDTGLVTELSPVNRRNFLDLFSAVAQFDGYRAGELMIERCRQPDAVIDHEVFCLRMQHLVLDVKSKTFALGNIKIADVLKEVLSLVRRHHVRLEGDFVNVVISILLLEGIGRQLDPNIDLFKSSLPILRQLGIKSGSEVIKNRDASMLKVWMGLEIREFLTTSVQDMESCVKYDLLSPNI